MLRHSFMPLRWICVVVVELRAPCCRSAPPDGAFNRYGSVEAISSAQHCLDQPALRIAELTAQQRDTLHKRVVGHKNVRPHCFDKLIFGDKPPCILGKIAQHFECLWRQSDLPVSVPQTSARQIERKTIEAEHSRRKCTHPLRPPSYTHSSKHRSLIVPQSGR